MPRIFLALAVALGVASACTELGPLSGEADLDGLFDRLKTAHSAEEAERIEVAILSVLSESGQDEVDSLTVHGLSALNEGDLDLALRMFNQVVARAPHFAEGWNLRATVYWMRDENRRAIADLRNVLVLEPRHFAAMTLLGRILVELGQPQAAMVILEHALKINPHLDDARSEIEMLRDQIAGVPI